MKYWQGKFNEGLDRTAEQFISTFAFDKRLYKHDIMGSIAHCTMLGEQGIISEEETKIIQQALTQIFYNITTGKIVIEDSENIYDFLDRELNSSIGEISKKLNIARTECDRAALDKRMYVKELCGDLKEELKKLIEKIAEISGNCTSVILPSEFNFIKASPTTLAHTLLAYAERFMRDAAKLDETAKNAAVMPLYSGYGTGVPYKVDRRRVAELLKFSSVTQNSLDAVTDNDYICEFLAATALISRHVSSFCSLLIDWCTKEVAFARLDKSVNTDSKAVPSFAEPSVLETLKNKSDKCARICLTSAATDNGAYYSRSDYEIIETVFEAESAIKNCLGTLTAVISSVFFDEQAMLKAATNGFTTALDCVEYLVKKGENRDTAYEIVGKLCEYCAENNKRLDTIAIDIYRTYSPLFEKDVIYASRAKSVARLRKNEGEPGEVAVRAELRSIKRRLNKLFPEE